MKAHGYSAEELSAFYAVLDRAVREAAEHNLAISIPAMVQRLFRAADQGERNDDRLFEAIFTDSLARPRRSSAA